MTYAYSVLAVKNVANVSTDRIFKLVPGEGGATGPDTRYKTNRGRPDMYTGDKVLHAIQDSGLWHLEFRTSTGQGSGGLPEPLKQRWTNFNQLIKFLVPYFKNRNVEIEEIIA